MMILRARAASLGRGSEDPLWGLSHTVREEMMARGARGRVAVVGRRRFSEECRPPTQRFWKNVRTKRTMRTKSVRRGPMERMRAAVLRPGRRRGRGVGMPFSRANAGIADWRGAGVGRIWDGHAV
jgi:hypothetical protein